MRAAASSDNTRRFERAQIGHRAAEREGKLLRLRAAGIVDHATVRDRERPAKAVAGEFFHKAREIGREIIPRPHGAAGRRHVPERIERRPHLDAFGRDAALLHQRGEVFRGVTRLHGSELKSMVTPASR